MLSRVEHEKRFITSGQGLSLTEFHYGEHGGLEVEHQTLDEDVQCSNASREQMCTHNKFNPNTQDVALARND